MLLVDENQEERMSMSFLPGFEPGTPAERAAKTLAERFCVPPFSVLDARSGYWQERKQAWTTLGIDPEVNPAGRKSGLTHNTANWFQEHGKTGGDNTTSVFDPVLCEIAYTWFCPTGGSVLDPFAGGSVRGIVASRLGRRYFGIELRPEQVAANEELAREICRPGDPRPEWVLGDARDAAALAGGRRFDLLFTCPPYGDLEVYSDDPRDLSVLPWEQFVPAFQQCIGAAADLLKPERFACLVVGDFREKGNGGAYRCFPEFAMAALHAAGARKYNEMVYVTPAGSLPIRVASQFPVSRKVGKSHQNVLVAAKGNPRAAANACGPIEVSLDAWTAAGAAAGEAAGDEGGLE